MDDTWFFEAIGTAWSIETAQPIDRATRSAVARRIESFDQTWSRFRTDSLVSRLRTEPHVDLGSDAPALLGLYDELFALSGGAVNPCVGTSLERLGYDAAYSLRPSGEPVQPASWLDCTLDGTVLSTPDDVVLDVGAVGKGYLVDQVANLLDQPCIVDASGDMVNRTDAPISVALEHPHRSDLAIGIVDLAPGQAICGSSTNRRTWADGIHHVVDARTGTPTSDVLSTWVVAESCAVADAYATALFFVAPELIEDRSDLGWVTVSSQLQVKTNRLPGKLFS